MTELEQLQKMIDESNSIVFLAGQEYLPKAGFRIFGVWMVCITRNTIILRKRY